MSSQDVPPSPSEKQQNQCNSSEIFELSSSSKVETCDVISVPSHPVSTVEMTLKILLLLFLLLCLVYHISNLMKSGSFEAETCDIDNQSNYLIFGSQWSTNKPRHNEQHHPT